MRKCSFQRKTLLILDPLRKSTSTGVKYLKEERKRERTFCEREKLFQLRLDSYYGRNARFTASAGRKQGNNREKRYTVKVENHVQWVTKWYCLIFWASDSRATANHSDVNAKQLIVCQDDVCLIRSIYQEKRFMDRLRPLFDERFKTNDFPRTCFDETIIKGEARQRSFALELNAKIESV